MIVNVLEKGVYNNFGTIRFLDDKVNFSFDSKYLFSKIKGSEGIIRTPKDGKKYMETLVEQFQRSTSVELIEEPIDKNWI